MTLIARIVKQSIKCDGRTEAYVTVHKYILHFTYYLNSGLKIILQAQSLVILFGPVGKMVLRHNHTHLRNHDWCVRVCVCVCINKIYSIKRDNDLVKVIKRKLGTQTFHHNSTDRLAICHLPLSQFVFPVFDLEICIFFKA